MTGSVQSQKRSVDALSEEDPGEARVLRARSLLALAQATTPELAAHDVYLTPADGLCFLHAVAMQLRVESGGFEWDVALAVLNYMAGTMATWQQFVDDEDLQQRLENLAQHGIRHEVEKRGLNSIELSAFAYILDRCCGVAQRDWGSPRLYCDRVFIQEFADWTGCPVLLLRCSEGGRVERIRPRVAQTSTVFTFKMAHYGDSPEHFNALCGSVDACPLLEAVRDKLCFEIRASRGRAYWCVDQIDVCLIAQEMLPLCETASVDSSSVDAGTEEESEDEAEPAPASPPQGEENPADSSVAPRAGDEVRTGSRAARPDGETAQRTVGRWIPRCMPAKTSPHPRAAQEERFQRLALEWHSWVTVPSHLGATPMTRDMLQAGVSLPQKHCFWSECAWSGKTNEERWRHIKSSHWSERLHTAAELLQHI